MRVALILGHKETSQGACNESLGITEWSFNKNVIKDIAKSMPNNDIIIVHRDTYKGLPEKVNNIDPDFIISLHCNSHSSLAFGTETLYYHKSEASKQIAKVVNNNIVRFVGTKDRGIKPKTSEDRGGYLLRYTRAPCVIAEPFFISNTDETKFVLFRYKELVEAYCNSINEIMSNCYI